MKIVVTGGLGFIGSAVIRHLIEHTEHHVVNVDVGTYAATEGSVAAVAGNDRYQLVRADIAERSAVRAIFDETDPDAVIHLAAESHVDRSIDDPGAFVRTNVVGTYQLLDVAREHAERSGRGPAFRFLHVSTDEVFGSLGADDAPFDETTPYDPRSPYSASKAGSDHLVRAWHETYGFSSIITNCSNNYGPFQFPEKLIPLMIIKGMHGDDLPVYGDGLNIRDWLYVSDHATALIAALERGVPGRTYAIGGDAERTNLDVVHGLCDHLDTRLEPLHGAPRRDLITQVTDRPGHDRRYAVNTARVRAELDWQPEHTFEEGLAATVDWYLANEHWWRPLFDRYEGERLGVGSPRS